MKAPLPSGCPICDAELKGVARVGTTLGESLACHCSRCGYYLLAPGAAARLGEMGPAARANLATRLALHPATSALAAVDIAPEDLGGG